MRALGTTTYSWVVTMGTGIPLGHMFFQQGLDPGTTVFGVVPKEQWTFLALTRTGATVRMYVDGALIHTAGMTGAAASTANDTEVPSQSSFMDGLISEVAIYDVALSTVDIAAIYATQRDDYPAERTDERIQRLLDEAGFPHSNLSVGQTVMSPTAPESDSILESIQTAVTTERGVFFISADGVPTFHDRHYRLLEQATPVTTLDETIYITPVLGLDDLLLANIVEVTPGAGLAAFTVTDEDSIEEFGPASLPVAIFPDDINEGLDYANYLLGLFANPELRLPSLHFNVEVVSPLDVLLGAELSNRYAVTAPLAGDDLDIEVFLEHISHTIDLNHNWTVDWQLSPASGTAGGQFWLLGVAGFSELGVTTVLGY